MQSESVEAQSQADRRALALTALILAIIVPPAGIILGFTVLAKRPSGAPHRLAVAAIVVGFVVLLAYLIALLSPAIFALVN